MRASTPGENAMPAIGSLAPDASPRDRLLGVANELFYKRGIRSVGIDEVIAAAGVAKMSLYRSFPSKDELVAAYLSARSELYWQWWDRITARHPSDPRAKLLALVDTLRKRTELPAWRGCPFTNAATEFPEPDHPGRRVAEANKKEMRKRLRGLAAAAGARKPEMLGDQLTLLFEGAYSSALTFGRRGPARAIVAAAKTLIDAQLPKRERPRRK